MEYDYDDPRAQHYRELLAAGVYRGKPTKPRSDLQRRLRQRKPFPNPES